MLSLRTSSFLDTITSKETNVRGKLCPWGGTAAGLRTGTGILLGWASNCTEHIESLSLIFLFHEHIHTPFCIQKKTW
jgi:hypothetical protein